MSELRPPVQAGRPLLRRRLLRADLRPRPVRPRPRPVPLALLLPQAPGRLKPRSRHERVCSLPRPVPPGTTGLRGPTDLDEFVLLDIDGTLIDSVDGHARAWQEILATFGNEITFDEVRSQIGKGGDQLMPVFLPKT